MRNRYIDAFERYDVDSLVALLHEDATLSMPPFELWLQGVPDIRRFLAALEVEGGRIAAIHAFLDPALFPVFGLPPTPEPINE